MQLPVQRGWGRCTGHLLYLHIGLRAQAGTAACPQETLEGGRVRVAAAGYCQPQFRQRLSPPGWRHICLRPSVRLHVERYAALAKKK